MGFTSEIHAKPLHFLKKADSAFQKEIQSFLAFTKLVEFTVQNVKPTSASMIQKKVAYGWERPSHFRSSLLILNYGWPAVFVNPRQPDQCSTARIPLLQVAIAKKGPVVLEVMLDASDRIVWVVDLLHQKGVNCWQTMPFEARYQEIHEIVSTCIQPNAVLQSCEVRKVEWRGLETFLGWTPTPKCVAEFIGSEPGLRRFLWRMEEVVKPKPFAAPPVCEIVDEPAEVHTPPVPSEDEEAPKKTSVAKNHTMALCKKDPKATGPDMYVLFSSDAQSLGSAALRSMPIRVALRKAFAEKEQVMVHVAWYDLFQKYEITKVGA